jgi:hypothetical protein
VLRGISGRSLELKMANLEIPFQDGMKIGLGYDQLSGEITPSAGVKGDSVTPIQQAKGQKISLDCVTIEDIESLSKQLGVSVAAGGSYMGFSASAKVDYVNSCNFSSYSTYVLVKVSVQNVFESMDNPIFNEDSIELISNGNTARFRERFGDCFISGIKTGGEFFAIYQITSTSQTDRESVAVKVHAAYRTVGAGADLDVAVNTANEHTKNRTEVQIHVFRLGSIQEIPMNPSEIMTHAKRFPKDVTGENSYPFAVLLQPYNRLESPNDRFNFYELQQQQDALQDMARRRFNLLKLKNDIAFILKYPSDFQNPDGSAVDVNHLTSIGTKVSTAINDLQRKAAACARDATSCDIPSFSELDSFRAPALRPGQAEPPPIEEFIKVPNFVGLTLSAILATRYYGPGFSAAQQAAQDNAQGGADCLAPYIDGFPSEFWKLSGDAEGDPRYPGLIENDLVIGQTPPAGALVLAGTKLKLTLKGPRILTERELAER